MTIALNCWFNQSSWNLLLMACIVWEKKLILKSHLVILKAICLYSNLVVAFRLQTAINVWAIPAPSLSFFILSWVPEKVCV